MRLCCRMARGAMIKLPMSDIYRSSRLGMNVFCVQESGFGCEGLESRCDSRASRWLSRLGTESCCLSSGCRSIWLGRVSQRAIVFQLAQSSAAAPCQASSLAMYRKRRDHPGVGSRQDSEEQEICDNKTAGQSPSSGTWGNPETLKEEAGSLHGASALTRPPPDHCRCLSTPFMLLMKDHPALAAHSIPSTDLQAQGVFDRWNKHVH
jgi:hypothetical protein